MTDKELKNEDEIEETQANDSEEPVIIEEDDIVSELEEKIAEQNDKYLRLAAEYDNFRKRTTKEKNGIYPRAQADTVAMFLPVLDNFERALSYPCDSEDFAQGIKMIEQNFGEVLKSIGVEVIGEVGDQFDPELHDAVSRIEDPELGEDVIAQVLQKGYKLGDRVIRHAVVQTAN